MEERMDTGATNIIRWSNGRFRGLSIAVTCAKSLTRRLLGTRLRVK